MNGPSALVFDVNETLSDLAPMGDRFEEVGAPAALARTWFASVLRDGFALAVVGAREPFVDIARATLRTVFAGLPLDRGDQDAVEHVMRGFLRLPVHPDVQPGLQAMSAAGLRLVTLSNGSVDVARSLLDRAGVAGTVETYLSVQDARRWKPAAEAYEHAVARLGLEAGAMLMVAVHPWDLDGAARAGLRTAWIDRTGAPYPPYFRAPDITAHGLADLARQLAT